MKIEYHLTEEDYLQLFLFTSSKSPAIRKNRRITYIFIIGFLVVIFGIFYQYFHEKTFYMFGFALFFSLLIHHFFTEKKSYELAFKREIKQSFKNKIDTPIVTYFGENSVITDNGKVKLEVKYENIDFIEETKNYFYLKLKTEERLIFPKNILQNTHFEIWIKEFARNHNLEIKNELNWKF